MSGGGESGPIPMASGRREGRTNPLMPPCSGGSRESSPSSAHSRAGGNPGPDHGRSRDGIGKGRFPVRLEDRVVSRLEKSIGALTIPRSRRKKLGQPLPSRSCRPVREVHGKHLHLPLIPAKAGIQGPDHGVAARRHWIRQFPSRIQPLTRNIPQFYSRHPNLPYPCPIPSTRGRARIRHGPRGGERRLHASSSGRGIGEVVDRQSRTTAGPW